MTLSGSHSWWARHAQLFCHGHAVTAVQPLYNYDKKFSEMRATRRLLWHSDFTKFNFDRGSITDPAEGAYDAPQTQSAGQNDRPSPFRHSFDTFASSSQRLFGVEAQRHRACPTLPCPTVCLKIEIHEIHMPKYRNPPTKYEIHCLEIEIHKGHKIHSKTTLAKYRNPRNPQTARNPHWQGSQQTNRQLL